MRMTVSILNSSPISREGLRRILVDAGIDVVCLGSRASDIDPPFASNHLVLIDLPTLADQLDALEAFSARSEPVKTFILTDTFDLEPMLSCFDHGALGYAIRDIGCEALIALLQLAALGHKVMPPDVAEVLRREERLPSLSALNGEATINAAKLSQREHEVLCCLMTGYSNKRIARTLCVSEATVKVHVKAILRKLNVMNRTQAAMWATARGIAGREHDVQPVHVIRDAR